MSLFPDGENLAIDISRGIENKIENTDPQKLLELNQIVRRMGPEGFLDQLGEKYPKIAEEIVAEYIQAYNNFVDSAVRTFPKTTDAYWQHYRRNRIKGSMSLFPDRNKTDAENDAILAEHYHNVAKIFADIERDTERERYTLNLDAIFGESKGELIVPDNTPLTIMPEYIPIDQEPRWNLIHYNPKSMLGIGKYIFMIEKREPVETVWDLRQKEIPRLSRH